MDMAAAQHSRPRGLRAHVLMYHDVRTQGNAEPLSKRSYDVSSELFTQHTRALMTEVRRNPSTDLAPAQAPAQWALTFDDGADSALWVADVLESVGWHAYFFVVGSWVGRKGFLDKGQLADLHRRGHVVGSHSQTHPDPMHGLPYAELVREWRASLDVLGETVGADVTTAAVPGGGYSSKVAAAAAEAGIEVLFTSEPTSLVKVVDGCAIIGRYAIRASTDSPTVAALALGGRVACGRQWLGWNSRKAAKKMLGGSYYSLRTRILSHGRANRP